MKKRLITLALICFGVLLVYDAVFEEPTRKLEISNSFPPGTQLKAKLQITGARYDLQSHSIRGGFSLYVRAIDDRDINGVAFSPTDTGAREWLAVAAKKGKLEGATQQAGNCQLQLADEDENGKSVSSASFDCKETSLASGSGTEEIWYPFDSYQVVIAPAACIDSLDGACGKSSKAQPAFIGSLNVVIGDQNLIASITRDQAVPNRYLLTLKRRFFVRMVSLVFLVLSVAFLVYLAKTGIAQSLLPQSLGFFGTLWGLRALIVPTSVTIFPTAVDFSILTIFCVLFLLVLRKV